MVHSIHMQLLTLITSYFRKDSRIFNGNSPAHQQFFDRAAGRFVSFLGGEGAT